MVKIKELKDSIHTARSCVISFYSSFLCGSAAASPGLGAAAAVAVAAAATPVQPVFAHIWVDF